jgi:very-short-patch-repair endonuclease
VPRDAHVPRSLRLLPFSGSAAIRDGLLTPSQLRGAAWTRLLPDVYISSAVDLDHRLWAGAALRYAGRGAAISGTTAAFAWGVDLGVAGFGGSAALAVEVTVPPDRRVRSRPPAVTVVRAALAPGDVTTFGQLTLTTPERTAVDLVRRRDRIDAVVALDAMLNRRVVTMDALAARATEMAGRYGGAAFGRAVRLADAGAASPMETRLRLLIVDARLPCPETQVEIRDAQGRFLGRADLAYRERRVCLEYEGDHHRERGKFRRDIARVNAFQDAGWIVVRVTADDIFGRPDQLIERIRRLVGEIRIAGQ